MQNCKKTVQFPICGQIAHHQKLVSEKCMDVFISYSSADQALADEVASVLDRYNLSFFLAQAGLKSGDTLVDKIRTSLNESQFFLVLLTPRSVKSDWVLTELGAAWGLGKQIIPVLYRSDVQDIPIPLRNTKIYDFGEIEEVVSDLSKQLTREENVRQRIHTQAQLAEKDRKLITQSHDNGLRGIYPNRSTALLDFIPHFENAGEIKIVGSSLEGFLRGIGLKAEDLLKHKLESGTHGSIKILLTHPDVVGQREVQEGEERGYIVTQVRRTVEMLARLKRQYDDDNRIEFRLYKGAPTCFMMSASPFMLINPYLNTSPGYHNFSLIVEDTQSQFDVYNRYLYHHFNRAWNSNGNINPLTIKGDQFLLEANEYNQFSPVEKPFQERGKARENRRGSELNDEQDKESLTTFNLLFESTISSEQVTQYLKALTAAIESKDSHLCLGDGIQGR